MSYLKKIYYRTLTSSEDFISSQDMKNETRISCQRDNNKAYRKLTHRKNDMNKNVSNERFSDSITRHADQKDEIRTMNCFVFFELVL